MKTIFGAALLVLSAVITGCASSPHLDVTNVLLNHGRDLDPEMRGRNLLGIVGFDEQHASTMTKHAHGRLWMQGVRPGTPEFGYRYVHVNMRQINGFLYYADGQFLWTTSAMVPDHIPKLKAGDIIEIRQEKADYTLKDFSKTGTGNIIVRVMCRAGDPEYLKCAETLPQVNKAWHTGPTGTPYPVSAREYGFTFTPAYDEAGKLIRQIPEYVKGTLPRHEFFDKPAVSKAN